ncbi:MAG: DUF2946 family protein [Rubrivivax sp.]
MDPIVEAALKKWPNVPHCYGWLALDARGDWYMRDDRIRAAGPFPRVKGSRILHDKLRAFIERNYAADERGCWFFQNGPQRVYVELAAAPFVWRLQANPDEGAGVAPAVHAHTGAPAAAVHDTWLDDAGRLFLRTSLGFGLVHTQDVAVAADVVEAGIWTPTPLDFDAMPARFGYQLQPQPPA